MHDSKAEAWDFSCNSISANKWPIVEDGGRVGRSGVPIWRVWFLGFVSSYFHNWVRVDIYTKD